MSGHSKWHRIKRKKAANDSKRGQEFTRLANQIAAAARNNPHPDQNPTLREAITRAKQANMPQDKIDKLLQKTSSSSQESVIYEAFGPGGVALLIIANTDNNKRTVAELRTILKKHNGSLSQPGSVAWKFAINSTGEYVAQYPQAPTAELGPKINQLVQELKNNPDVTSVATDTNK